MNKIRKYTIEEKDYIEPILLFETLDRGFMPSMLTGKGPKDISKESIIGLNPHKRERITKLESLWDRLGLLNDSTNFHDKPFPINHLGGIGYISYEALHSIESIHKLTTDNITMPFAEWIIYTIYYYFDHTNNKLYKISLEFDSKDIISGNNYKDNGFKVTNIKADFTPNQYRDNVRRILNEIKNGEVYEVNLTQGLVGDFQGSPYSLFKNLYKHNSAPFSAYLERDDLTIISNSPELFLKAIDNLIETRPIKGTAPRGKTYKEDEDIKIELIKSLKNQAELYMIVDLMRNDLSRVCELDSVKVKTSKRVEKYKNVHHLVSIIQGKLKEDLNYIDLFKATFPGGSITGCPKIRCMELTEEIERSSRNLYTGTIFLMNRSYLNSSIVIRSAVVKDKKIVLNSGGAITIDSNPEEEYRESRIKLESLFKVVNYEDNI